MNNASNNLFGENFLFKFEFKSLSLLIVQFDDVKSVIHEASICGKINVTKVNKFQAL